MENSRVPNTLGTHFQIMFIQTICIYKSYGCNITHYTNANDTPAPFLIGLALPCCKIMDRLRNLDLT